MSILSGLGAKKSESTTSDVEKTPLGDSPALHTIESVEGANTSQANEERFEEAKDQNNEPLKQTGYQGFNSDPSAFDLGVGEKPELEGYQQVLAEDSAARHGVGNVENDTVYSCHPIQNLRVGPFTFEGTVLKLKGAALTAFEKLLKDMPLSEANNIRKIDSERVNAIVDQFKAHASQNFDSSVGRGAMEAMRGQFPLVGTQDVRTAHAAMSQTDQNVEVPVPADGVVDRDNADSEVKDESLDSK